MGRRGHDTMADGTQTLGELIQQAARETGADASFVEHVETLFARKDIGLDIDATPWVALVRETFERHVELTQTVARVRKGLELLDELHETLHARAESLQVQLLRLHRSLVTLREHAQRLQGFSDGAPLAAPSGWLN
jgi:hypothetical protein